jgi:hypothetical protein
MSKKLVILLVLLVALAAHPHQRAECPLANVNKLFHGTLLLILDHLRVSSIDGLVRIQNNSDVLCYNYSLPTPFDNNPGVAICKLHV